MGYEEIEHTADWAFHVRGQDLRELFVHAAQAIFQREHGDVREADTVCREFAVEGADRETLLVNWLNELLYTEQTEREAYHHFEILQMDDTHLRARVHGAPIEECERHLKAVTFHNLELKRTPNGWEATVVVDV